MNNVNKLACTAALIAALPLSAPAATTLDYFLKIDGVQGESQDKTHKDEIDVLSWSWGTSNSGAGPVFDSFAWEQGMDRSFVPLFLDLVNGDPIRSAILTVRRNGTHPFEFFRMTLTDAQMVSLSSAGSGDSLVVDAAMDYGAISMHYCMQSASGGTGPCSDGSFALDHGRLSFSGDSSVLNGLVEAGGTLSFINPGPTVPVPEPATWASLMAGLCLVATVLRRRRQPARQG